MANPNVSNVRDAEFQSEVLASDTLVLVDFWAEWCAPCRALAPTIDELANDYSGQMKVMKLNVDESPAAPAQFGIRGIPTVLIFKGGRAVGEIVGRQPKEAFVQAIEKALTQAI